MFQLINFLSVISNISYVFLYESCNFIFFHRKYLFFISNIVEKLTKINVLYVKLFQGIAFHQSFISDEVNSIILKYTDNATWNKSDIDYDTLDSVLKTYNINSAYDLSPINSGMISLVFKVTTDDKKDIIIKLKRKNIDQQLNNSINDFLSFLYLLNFVPYVKQFEIYKLCLKNIEIIQSQLDFEKELKNTMKIKENFKNIDYVEIPTVYPEATTKYSNVIVMSYINGVKINDIQKSDYLDFAKSIIKFGLVSTLLHGCSHGDLHPGNILFIKEHTSDNSILYKIGVIDFGIMYHIQENTRKTFFDLSCILVNGTTEETTENMINSGAFIVPIENIKKLKTSNPVSYNKLYKSMYNIVHLVKTKSKSIFSTIFDAIKELSLFLKENNSISRCENTPYLSISEDLLKVQLCLSMTIGITFKLCQDVDYYDFADNLLKELFHLNLFDDTND